MSHPNLSDDLNRKIDSPDPGVFIKDLPVGTCLRVYTQNSKYLLVCLGDQRIKIRGDGRYFQEQTEATLAGSTWGGSCLKVGWVGVGMHMEVWSQETGTVTTSEIRKVQIVELSQPDGL